MSENKNKKNNKNNNQNKNSQITLNSVLADT